MRSIVMVAALLCIIALATDCASPCLNGGVCTKGACVCPLGFIGRTCSRRGCGSNCSGRGYCDLSSKPATCLCFPGFTGRTCESTVAAAPVLSAAAQTALAKSAAPKPAAAAKPNTKSADKQSARRKRKAAQAAAAAKAKAAPSAASKSDATAAQVKKLRKDRGLCTPECAAGSGFCFKGSCLCANGFTGPTCALRLCPKDCSARGSCDQATGVCDCYAPYTGRTCEIASKPIIPRKPDTLQDVDGPLQADEKDNQVIDDKPGQSDAFHLIELEAREQQ